MNDTANIGNGILGLALFIGIPSAALSMGRSDASGLFVFGIAICLAMLSSYWPRINKGWRRSHHLT